MRPHLTPRRPWQPLSDAEFQLLAPYFVHGGVGRPMHDLRGRLDAIFRVVTGRGFWKDLPAEFGPWDTAHRQFRRWAHKGVWTALLKAVARTRNPVLAGLEHWLCCAYRRCWRITGLCGVRLVRRLGLYSAFRGPVWMMPDPDLSDKLKPVVLRAIARALQGPRKRLLEVLAQAKAYHHVVGGRLHIPRAMCPP